MNFSHQITSTNMLLSGSFCYPSVSPVELFFSPHGVLSSNVKIFVSFKAKIYFVACPSLSDIKDLIGCEAIKLHRIQVS